MVDAFFHEYVLLSAIDARLLGFEHIKELYKDDNDFAKIFHAWKVLAFGKYYWFDGYLFKENHLCAILSSMCELLVWEA